MIIKQCDVCGKSERREPPYRDVIDTPDYLRKVMESAWIIDRGWIFQSGNTPGPIDQICSDCERPIRKKLDEMTKAAFFGLFKIDFTQVEKNYGSDY